MGRPGLLVRLRRRASAAVTSLYGKSTCHRRANRVAASGLTGGICEASPLTSAPLPPSEGGDGNLLYNQAVTPAVKDGYRRAVATFIFYCCALSLPMDSRAALDDALCNFVMSSSWKGAGLP